MIKWISLTNLNTSYVDIKHMHQMHTHKYINDLNTSYVDIKLRKIKSTSKIHGI